MRLARPVYETLPFIYVAIGGFAMLVSYHETQESRAAAAFAIGIIAEIAALTLLLRRRDYRDLRREYSGETDLYSGGTNLHDGPANVPPAESSAGAERQLPLDL
jgi:hypothetical protein